MCVFGTRPEAVKMSPLVLALKTNPVFNVKVLVTAQHREMLDSVLNNFHIMPDFDLNLMKTGQAVEDVAAKALTGVKAVLDREKPDIVLVHGDTTTTFAAALAAFYSGCAVGHVEAGLRTYNKREPFPEEINRLLTTPLADIFFAPTAESKKNLEAENIDGESAFVTGNTEIDAIKIILSREGDYRFKENILNKLDYSKRIIVMTSHRRENLGQPMEAICQAMARVVAENKDTILVWPVHPNPEVQKTAYGLLDGLDRVYLTPNLEIEDMYRLMSRCYMSATDSAAIQEISPVVHKPCVVLRNVTERPEGITTGVLILGGNGEETVYQSVSKVLSDKNIYAAMAKSHNPYGDGKASGRIADALLYAFGEREQKPEEFKSPV